MIIEKAGEEGYQLHKQTQMVHPKPTWQHPQLNQIELGSIHREGAMPLFEHACDLSLTQVDHCEISKSVLSAASWCEFCMCKQNW